MLDIQNGQFIDENGRRLTLRGVNLSGASKTPENCPSHNSTNFFASQKSVSFVNRPFPLEEANVHFARLRLWGFNFLRINITWEAIEHQGPGIYDMEYIDYLVSLLKIAKLFQFKVFIDPHQDVWSRFSGGSGLLFII